MFSYHDLMGLPSFCRLGGTQSNNFWDQWSLGICSTLPKHCTRCFALFMSKIVLATWSCSQRSSLLMFWNLDTPQVLLQKSTSTLGAFRSFFDLPPKVQSILPRFSQFSLPRCQRWLYFLRWQSKYLYYFFRWGYFQSKVDNSTALSLLSYF